MTKTDGHEHTELRSKNYTKLVKVHQLEQISKMYSVIRNYVMMSKGGNVSSVLALESRMNHRNIIENNLEGLVENIDVKNTTLWERLVELGLFDSCDVEYIRVRTLKFLDSLKGVI